MLVSMKEMLEDAQRHQYAIPAFDISNYEMMRAVLEVCQEERSPALLMGLEPDLAGKGLPLLTSMVSEASRYFSVPVCFHLDHATSLTAIRQAADAGFRSVMYDGSMLSFGENAARTGEVVTFAHAMGITVEAELGHVGNAMVGNLTDNRRNEDPEETLTLPEEAAKFVEWTGVDALAVAIGTSHGVYAKTPALRIDRLDEITAVCHVPLVLHGGSGTPEHQLQTAIRHGITKINIFSDLVTALNTGLKTSLGEITNPAAWPVFVFEDARRRMRETVREKIRAFGSYGRI